MLARPDCDECIFMEPMINIAISAARRAGEVIIRKLERIDTLTINEKQANDFVTEVDIQSEQIIIDTIRNAYPNHAILAEESGEHPGEDVVWIIDPLDGTKNYCHGFPHIAISIAVQIKNKIEHGLIYDPLRQEFFTASRGRGAQLNARRIRVTQRKQLQHALLGTGFPFRDKKLLPVYLKTFESLFMQCGGVRRAGSAALDLAYVAAGRLDGFWEFGLKPWDIAAGTLMIKEAGGLVSDFQGGETYMQSGNIVAGNPKIFKHLLQVLQPLVK